MMTMMVMMVTTATTVTVKRKKRDDDDDDESGEVRRMTNLTAGKLMPIIMTPFFVQQKITSSCL